MTRAADPMHSLALLDTASGRGGAEAPSDASPGLHLERVSVSFGKVRALSNVSLDLRPAEVLMLVGPNGAGKSTLIHVLLGLVRPDSGALEMGGRAISINRSFKARLGYLPEAVAFSENLTGVQVLRFFARARAIDKKRITTVLERVGLTAAAKRRVGGYSRGMRQRLGLGIAILSEPSLLVLDEPTGGLDQEGLEVLFDVLTEWREAGRTVLMATHDLTLLERRVDRVCVLQNGHRIAFDTPAALRGRAALPIRVTLGVTEDRAGLLAALREWGRGEVVEDPERIMVEAHPGDLMALMDVRTAHAEVVTSLRVEEPGMDEVYERLLQAGSQQSAGAKQ